MSRIAFAHLPVRWIWHGAPGIAGGYGLYALQPLEDRFEAPETAAAESQALRIGRSFFGHRFGLGGTRRSRKHGECEGEGKKQFHDTGK
jgi:hypothetical protein